MRRLICPVCQKEVKSDKPHFHGSHVVRRTKKGIQMTARPGAEPQPIKIKGDAGG